MVAPQVRNGGSRHTGPAAPPHKNIQFDKKDTEIMELITEKYAITNQEAERLMKEA